MKPITTGVLLMCNLPAKEFASLAGMARRVPDNLVEPMALPGSVGEVAGRLVKSV